MTLFSGDTDVTYQLRGDLIQSPIEGCFYFSGLTIHEQGVYCVRISLYQMDLYSCLRGIAQVGCVDSSVIIIGPRTDGMAIRRSIGDITRLNMRVEKKLTGTVIHYLREWIERNRIL